MAWLNAIIGLSILWHGVFFLSLDFQRTCGPTESRWQHTFEADVTPNELDAHLMKRSQVISLMYLICIFLVQDVLPTKVKGLIILNLTFDSN